MSIKDQKKLFERFGKSYNSSGIGLFYVKELVNLHKGNIKVESQLHIGTTFTVTIPINKESYSENEMSQQTTSDFSKSFLTSYPNNVVQDFDQNEYQSETSILIIEDNDEMKEYLLKKFSRLYKVYLASNGKEGVEYANKFLPDLIICDVMMPIMDGIEATQILHKNFNTSHIPIILLTANSSEERKLEGLSHGADDYINKPFNFKFLEIKIKNIIAQRKKLNQCFINDPKLPVDILTQYDQDKKFIKKVTLLIEDNLIKPDFTVDKLSSEMGCSRTLFYKKMKGITGDTPNKFITAIQMKKAALLLRNTDYSLMDISIMIGYNDKAFFSRIFKKYYGITPKTYQLQNRK